MTGAYTHAVACSKPAGTYQWEPAPSSGYAFSPLNGLVITPFTTMP
jgi:hypothetical protein